MLTGSGNSSSSPPVSYSGKRGPSQIYRGITNTSGQVTRWSSATPSVTVDNFFANPYHPSELYAISTAAGEILSSPDSGTTWKVDQTLTDIATNHGEYRVGCTAGSGGRGTSTATSPFTDGCSLSGMAFDPFTGVVRVAAMFYGGIAFSRDGGRHWMALDITHNNHLNSNDLNQIVTSVFFDGETHGKPSKKKSPIPGPDQRIYYGLKGQSLRMVLGPFLDLESLNFSLKVAGSHVVDVYTATPSFTHTVHLYRNTAAGEYRGSLLYDYKTAASVNFEYTVDGVPGYKGSHVLTAAEKKDGVASESH